METVTLAATIRTEFGSIASRRQRAQGWVPGIVYGHKEENVAILINRDELIETLKHGTQMLEIKLPEKTESALIKEIQYDHLGDDMLNVDFARVSLTETVTVSVEVVLHGTPKGTHEGGHLDQMEHSLAVACLPKDIPEKLDFNVAELGVNDSLTVAEVTFPDGVTCSLEPATKIAMVHEARGPMGAEGGEGDMDDEEGSSSEPEVLRQKKIDEEEDSK